MSEAEATEARTLPAESILANGEYQQVYPLHFLWKLALTACQYIRARLFCIPGMKQKAVAWSLILVCPFFLFLFLIKVSCEILRETHAVCTLS